MTSRAAVRPHGPFACWLSVVILIFGVSVPSAPAWGQTGVAGIVVSGSGDPPSVEELAIWAGPEGPQDRARQAILGLIETRGPGEAATLWVELLSVLSQVEPTAAPAAVRAVALGVEGEGRRGSDLLMEAVTIAGEPNRPPLLALAAHLADQQDERRGAEIRSELLAGYPDASVSAEATLLQAKWLLRTATSRDEGLALLEAFILARPEHPLAPEARRLYREGGGRS